MNISNPEVGQDCTEEEAEARKIMESDTYKIAIALGWVFNHFRRKFHKKIDRVIVVNDCSEMDSWIESPAGTEAMERKFKNDELKRRMLSDTRLDTGAFVPLGGGLTNIDKEIAAIRQSRALNFK